MTARELVALIDDALARHAARGGDADDAQALVLTLIAPTTRGLGVRPLILERRADGSRVIGLTARTATRLRGKLTEAGA